MTDDDVKNTERNASARVEALLFVATGPVTPAQLAESLQVPVKEVEEALEDLRDRYISRGMTLQKYSGKFQLTSAAEFAADIERFLGLEQMSRLSRAAIETMAIIAYRQPITRADISAIRGVDSDGVVRTLIARGLIDPVGLAIGLSTTVFGIVTMGIQKAIRMNEETI